MSFSSLNLHSQLIKTLVEKGYEEPTPIQSQAIPLILEGHDVMAGAQTGTGKTAAFALPLLNKLIGDHRGEADKQSVKALILTPTRELAQQVHANIETYAGESDITTALVYGGVSIQRQVDILKKGADIVVATPGRLLDHLIKGVTTLDQVDYLVFDEADRMLDMGFIDEINSILRRVPENRQTMLFSATFDKAIFKLSKRLLNNPKLVEVNERNKAAQSVEQVVYNVDADRKRELVSHLIGAKNWHQVLIFVRTKLDADALAKEMCKDGLKTVSIHGDKSQGAREKALSEFKNNDIRALVATDVAARGLDIKDLNYVINYQLPFIAEDYIHRIGRTGRAGNTGLAISLMSIGEEYLLEEIESILDNRIPQQWLQGYEPDLTKEAEPDRRNSKNALKRRAKKRAFGNSTGNKRKPNR